MQNFILSKPLYLSHLDIALLHFERSLHKHHASGGNLLKLFYSQICLESGLSFALVIPESIWESREQLARGGGKNGVTQGLLQP